MEVMAGKEKRGSLLGDVPANLREKGHPTFKPLIAHKPCLNKHLFLPLKAGSMVIPVHAEVHASWI